MSTKAKTLLGLQNKLSLFSIPELLTFQVSEYEQYPREVVSNIKTFFNGDKLVFRSSAAGEDGIDAAMAGAYDSVLDVSSVDDAEIHQAIEQVIISYRRDGRESLEDEFIVQKMLSNTSMSGVVFTHDLNTGAPYYVINYDDISGMTDTVTSGGGEYSNRTLYIHRGKTDSVRSKRFKKILSAIQELESIMSNQYLDIEFALDAELNSYLLQARPITTRRNWNKTVGNRIDMMLEGIQNFVKHKLKPIHGVYGDATVLGQMPDWNPAEMIGRAPRALAYSLYKCLITDHAWRIARNQMGYATPSGQPLMVSLAGQPFIDTRLSFHSFLPSKLSKNIANKLVNAWVHKLKEEPALHDKIEFDVAITTYSFDLDERLSELTYENLTKDELSEFRQQLFKQTINLLFDKDQGGITHALSRIKELELKQKNYSLGDENCALSSLFGMIDDCIQYGTVPFSILARHGFIAQTLLYSLQKIGVLNTEDVDNIRSGISTVASELVDDMSKLQTKEISKEEIMKKYGHLRPGTYDILSKRYDQMPDFSMQNVAHKIDKDKQGFKLSKDKLKNIDELLAKENFLGLDSQGLLNYIQQATAGREYGKFVFTRSVSDILEQIACYGEQYGLVREELSHIKIESLIEVATSSSEDSIQDRLHKIAAEEKEKNELSNAIRLPQILFDEEGVHVVPFQVSYPNFITNKNITAELLHLENDGSMPELNEKIILIENADPGFDWIFSQNIGGLITKYGGANSHMAIRCAEFSIPAAIGCGEQRYDVLLNTEMALLDCTAGLIKPLH